MNIHYIPNDAPWLTRVCVHLKNAADTSKRVPVSRRWTDVVLLLDLNANLQQPRAIWAKSLNEELSRSV